MTTLPECGSRAVIVAVTCSHCGERATKTLNLPADVQLSMQPNYICPKCTPKVETLSKRDDFMLTQEEKWAQAGGETAYKRKLGRERKQRWVAAHRVEYNDSQRELMRKRRANPQEVVRTELPVSDCFRATYRRNGETCFIY